MTDVSNVHPTVEAGSIMGASGWDKREIRPFDRAWGRVYCRSGTYDEYVVREIAKSYGDMDVRGHTVLDIGANIGAFSIFALFSGAAHVIAVEPEPGNLAMLRLNVERLTPRDAEGKPLRVTVVPCCLIPSYSVENLSRTHSLFLSKTGLNPGNTTMYPTRGRAEITVPQISLVQVWEEHGPFHRIKFDCEGAEYEIFGETSPFWDLVSGMPDFEVIGELDLQKGPSKGVRGAFGLAMRLIERFEKNGFFVQETEKRDRDDLVRAVTSTTQWHTLVHFRRL